MTKKLSLLLAIVVIASLVLTACAPAATPTEAPAPAAQATEPVAAAPTEAPAATEPAAAPTEAPAATEAAVAGEAVKACQVTDTGGIDDKSFNATAWAGVEKAMDELDAEGKYLESQQQTDYEKNINAFIEEGCDLIVPVGFLLADATKASAETNPDQNFAIVDVTYDPPLDNVLGLAFATDEAAFLAGYLAAGMTQTGKIGTFGGIPIPPVTIFMEGLARGVAYYNQENGTDVEVLGWNPETQEGLFTGNFESTDDGRTLGQTLLGEGADIIMPVAGPVGLGTAEAVRAAGNAWIIGVDTDWTVSAEQYKDIVLTSVTKNMDVAVFDSIKAVQDGTFEGGVYTGTLENGGVGLGTMPDSVPADLLAQIETVRKGIVDGSISIK